MVNERLVFTGDLPASTISSRVRSGELIQIARRVYSRDVATPVEDQVRAHLHTIVGRHFPSSVITDRSARTGTPTGGVLFLSHEAADRDLDLPGVLVRARRGAGPMEGDVPLPHGVHLASRARGLAENARPSRSRTTQARTLNDEELEDWIDFLVHNEGEHRLRQYRADAETMAPALGVKPTDIAKVGSMIGVALGTNETHRPSSEAMRMRRSRTPVDQVCMKRLSDLADALRRAHPQSRPISSDADRYRYQPFFEAYFSNFIEGTEFDVDEAAEIVFDGKVPADRPADAHDVLGTYRLASDVDEMNLLADSADDFIAILRRRSATIMEHRTDKNPGMFKTLANRAGATEFVSPELVEGTLRAGWERLPELDTPWERAVYTAFLVSEVHPFDDGNGRTARIMMNAELCAAGQTRIIVPTVYRTDYLDGLRALSRRDDPSILIKSMRYAQDFSASIDFTDYTDAKSQLEQSNAFNEPESSDRLRVVGPH